MKRFELITTCASHDGPAEHLMDMTENALEVTYKTFIKYVDYRDLLAFFGTNPSPKYEPYIGFYRSKYRGKRCYFVEHSNIEYVFQEI